MSALGQEQATELARITRSGSLAINIRCYPPRLVFGEQLRRRSPSAMQRVESSKGGALTNREVYVSRRTQLGRSRRGQDAD